MGSSTSKQYDYDGQLLADASHRYSYTVEGTENQGGVPSSAIIRSAHLKPDAPLLVGPHEADAGGGPKTLWDSFQRGVRVAADSPCFGTRAFVVDPSDPRKVQLGKDGLPVRDDFQFLTYKEVDREVRDLGRGLIALGMKPQDTCGILSLNRAEWVTAAFAMYSQNMRLVALYATLGPDAVEYIASHSEIQTVFCAKDNLRDILSIVGKTRIKNIIQFDPVARFNNVHEYVDDADRQSFAQQFADRGAKLWGMSEVLALGRERADIFPTFPVADDVAYIMYTSGTTGNPKGVLLAHRNITSTIGAAQYEIPFNNEDVYLSYLPLAHIFECCAMMLALVNGARVGFFSGHIKRMNDDLLTLRPTIFAGVPRVFQRFYSIVFQGINAKGFISRAVFHHCYHGQADYVRHGQRSGLYDVVLGKARKMMGLDRCRRVVTGAAPCPAYVIEFLKVIVGCPVLQGYGMTESAAGIAIVTPDDANIGHCGPPIASNEVRLVDIDDMNYRHTDKPYPRGEICARGPNVFLGYYKDDEQTQATIKDGWLHTGDVGRLNPNGTISIIDRKKNMFKLSQGEYVAVERVEGVYQKCTLVGQVWVYGNSFKNTLLVVCSPSIDPFVNHCLAQGWWPKDKANVRMGSPELPGLYEQVFAAHADEIKQWMFAALKEEGKHGGLKGFEAAADILVEHRIDADGFAFSVGNDLLTPTFKLRRPQLLQRYKAQLQDMYAKIGEPNQAGEVWPGV